MTEDTSVCRNGQGKLLVGGVVRLEGQVEGPEVEELKGAKREIEKLRGENAKLKKANKKGKARESEVESQESGDLQMTLSGE